MEIGKTPNFVVTDLEGKKIELKDFKGKGVFLTFGVRGVNLVRKKCLI